MGREKRGTEGKEEGKKKGYKEQNEKRKEDEILKCAKKLYNRLDETSFVIIGDFDLDEGNIPKFLTELGIDSATDTWKEETILQKHDGYSDGKYKDELLMNVDAYYYHKKKC